jgi:hypothetical protein
MRIRDGDSTDPGWKKVGSGINIPDPQHCLCPAVSQSRNWCLGPIVGHGSYRKNIAINWKKPWSEDFVLFSPVERVAADGISIFFVAYTVQA